MVQRGHSEHHPKGALDIMTEKGYFVRGAFVKGIHPSLIGKKIIRTCPCDCGGYLDYSYSYKGKYDDNRKDEWVLLRDIINGCLFIDWMPKTFPEGHILEEHWNDGNWVELSTLVKDDDE
jgi:hypothetical protein